MGDELGCRSDVMSKLVGGSPTPGQGSLTEIQEFASFPAGTQRYIRRALDIGLDRHDAAQRWSRDVMEEANIRAQVRIYERLDVIRNHAPDQGGIDALEHFLAPLISISAFDLAQGRLTDFTAYRFLYERLLGARARPWLPAAFCAAACLPHLHPDLRRRLLQSISETAATATGWSGREPSFFPQWVDKVGEAQSETGET
jgi:hypothetical protein